MSELFDVAIIGGGVNGAGIARDAAGRGGKVLLLEAHDLAAGTSSKSTKLVHGGLRYLEYYEFALVREALSEREKLWSIAPHIVWPMRFVLPIVKGMRPRWMLRAGLFLYDTIGGRSALPATSSIKLTDHPAGAHMLGGLEHGFEYSDCWVDDARLVVLNARDAANHGAQIRLHEPLTKARRGDDGHWLLETPQGQYHARALVNAAGPKVDDLARIAGEKPAYGIRRVRGSHIVVKRRLDHDYGYILQLPDTRICFVLPFAQGMTLIGTTDADHTGDPVEAEASEEEITYLLNAFDSYFDLALSRDQVVHSYAGVRALVDDGEGRPEAATRGYKLVLSDDDAGAPSLGIYGGKITSYRHLAQEAVDLLAGRLDSLAGPQWTADKPLPGGDFAIDGQPALIAGLVRDYPFLSGFDAERIGRAYGTDARRWLGDATSREALGRDFGCGFSEAELTWLREEEWARTADDVLWRRTKLGLHLSAGQQRELAEFMDALALK